MRKECEYCGNSFTGQRRSRKYCSDNCKQMAYYKRNGFVLAGNAGFVSSPQLNVKYDNTLCKQDNRPDKKLVKLIAGVPFQDETMVSTEATQRQELERTLRHFTVNDIDDKNILQQNECVNIISELNGNSSESDNGNLENCPAPPVTKSDTIKYQWIDSVFLEFVKRYLNDDNIDLRKYRYNAEYMKVLECFKCLTGVLIQLSNRPKVKPDFFIKIITAFSSLVQSKIFSSIPVQFPFISVIRDLVEKLTLAAEYDEITKVHLTPKRKAFLISMRFKMGKDVRDLKLSQVIT